MNPKYMSRKFWLTCISIGLATVALFTEHLDGTGWVTAMLGALGVYGASNVAEKRN
jgi:hypothetical protein